MQTFMLTTGALVLLALLLLFTAPTRSSEPIKPETVRQVTAVGEGEVKAKPDQATVRFRLQQRSVSAPTTEAAHRRQIDQFVARLKAAGMDVDRIQVKPMTLHQLTGEPSSLSWVAESEVALTLKDPGKANDLVFTALAEEGVSLMGVEYGLVSSDPLVQRALEAALAGARSRADQLAGGVSGRLGDAVSVEMIESPAIQVDSVDQIRVKVKVRATFSM
jgi:uncharacterized protein YggE